MKTSYQKVIDLRMFPTRNKTKAMLTIAENRFKR